MNIEAFKQQIEKKAASISSDRKIILNNIARKIITTMYGDGQCHLLFVCTHNSRRSQAAQLLFNHFIQNCHFDIEAYSAGTEATCFNQSMIKAANHFDFPLSTQENTLNPVYTLSLEEITNSNTYFSKIVEHKINPVQNTIAVMVCNDADRNCPIITSAKYRIPLPYKDPKASDGTTDEQATYQATFIEIGAEMYYLIDFLNTHR